MELIKNQVNEVSGGHPVAAVAVAVQVGQSVYLGTFELMRASEGYGDIGKLVSEKLFEATHPDPLGKMTYTAQDFVQRQ